MNRKTLLAIAGFAFFAPVGATLAENPSTTQIGASSAGTISDTGSGDADGADDENRRADSSKDSSSEDGSTATLPRITVRGAGAPKRRYTDADATLAGLSATPVREIPQSVQILTRDLIDDQGSLSLGEVLNNVPSVSNSIARSIPFSNTFIRIRGQQAAIYRDGLRTIDFMDIDPSALNNLQSVEVMEGPVGLIYGSGGPGGIINLVSKQPTRDFQANVAATVGQRNTRIVNGDVSVPLTDKLGLRVTAEKEDSDGFIDYAGFKRQNYAAILVYNPVDPLKLTVRYEHLSNNDDNAMPRLGLPVAGTLTQRDQVRIGRSTYLGEPALDYQHSSGGMAFAKAEYDISDGLKLTAEARRSTVDLNQSEIRNLGAVNLATFLVTRTRARRLDLDETQKNGRIFATWNTSFNGIDNTLIAGYEYFNFDLQVRNFNTPNGQIPPINVINPVYLPPGSQVTRNPAAPFLETDRYDELFVHNVTRIGAATVTAAVRRSNADFEDNFDDPSSLGKTVQQLGATYALNDKVSLFAGYDTGFDANSGISTLQSRTGKRFKPEFFDQYEVGVKTDLLANVTATASVFNIRRDDILVADPIDADFSIQAGQERTRGFETNLVWQSSDALSVRAGYAYLDAVITENSDPSLIGQRRPNVPRNTVNAYANYQFQEGPFEGLQIGGGFNYFGPAFASVTNTIERPNYTIANLSASYFYNRYRFDLFASNLFDKEYYIPANDTKVTPGEPRLITFRVSAKF